MHKHISAVITDSVPHNSNQVFDNSFIQPVTVFQTAAST